MKILNKKTNLEVALVPKTEGKLPIEFLKKTSAEKAKTPEVAIPEVKAEEVIVPEVKEEVVTPETETVEETTDDTVVVDSAEDAANLISDLAEKYDLTVNSDESSAEEVTPEAETEEKKPEAEVKPEEKKPEDAPAKTFTADEVAAMLTAMGVKVVDEKKPEPKKAEEKAKTKLPQKKTEEKPKAPEKPKVELKPETTPKVVPQVKLFPATLDVPNVGKMNLALAKYVNCKQIAEAIDRGYVVLFANYWNKRHMKQYNYAQTFGILPQYTPKEFPNDLDLAQTIYVCEINKGKLYASSIMTDAMYSFFDSDLVEEDGVRVSNGMEFQIYDLLIPEAPTEETTEEAPKA